MGAGGDGNGAPPFQSLVQFNSTNIYRVPTHAGLPWWLSGKESTCQCRRRGLDPRSGQIPPAAGQQSLYTAATGPEL